MTGNSRWSTKNAIQSAVEKADTTVGTSDAHLLGEDITTVEGTASGQQG